LQEIDDATCKYLRKRGFRGIDVEEGELVHLENRAK
jgi:hypothetical protein